MPGVDPIRCEPRFVAAVDRLKIVDYRAARMCAKGIEYDGRCRPGERITTCTFPQRA